MLFIKLFIINIVDDNDNVFKFVQRIYQVYISENKFLGMKVVEVFVKDVDFGVNVVIRYFLDGDYGLVIDFIFGVIVISRSLDREVIFQIIVRVLVVD